MSAPLAGKFQDHYEVLGIDPKADNDVVQETYARLAKKYHPKNAETGDEEKFQAVNLAYEILSDGVLRREFDKLKGIGEEEGGPKFMGVAFFDALGQETGIRTALLCVLYDRRRAKPFTPSLTMRHLENMLESSVIQLNFALWYLKQRGYVVSDDKSSLQITAEGMDLLEKNPPTAAMVMPFIKTAALASPSVPGSTPAPAPAAPAEGSVSPEAASGQVWNESVIKALDRALSQSLS
jgi:curved DNA-binding protein CbpA